MQLLSDRCQSIKGAQRSWDQVNEIWTGPTSNGKGMTANQVFVCPLLESSLK